MNVLNSLCGESSLFTFPYLSRGASIQGDTEKVKSFINYINA